jgi:nicotinamidase-related amidase
MFPGKSNLPKVNTRKALILFNLQNGAFDGDGHPLVLEPPDFVNKISTLIPYFRRIGDVVWVRTRIEKKASKDRSAIVDPEQEQVKQTAKLSIQDAPERGEIEFRSSETTTFVVKPTAANQQPKREKKSLKRELASPEPADKPEDAKGRTTRPSSSETEGEATDPPPPTKDATEFVEEMIPHINEDMDLMIVKSHYSAFERTSLLMNLRKKLVTHIYLCGLLSNVSIYETAVHAAQHGFDVTLLEDCMGYRSASKHLDSMRKMADMLGANGMDTDELIDEIVRPPSPPAVVEKLETQTTAGAVDTVESDESEQQAMMDKVNATRAKMPEVSRRQTPSPNTPPRVSR